MDELLLLEVILSDEAQLFAQQYDPNPAHIDYGSNLILPSYSVSGIYLLSLINKAVLESSLFKNLLCASEIHLNFIKPLIIGDKIKVLLCFQDSEHPFKKNILKRDAYFSVYRENEITTKANIKYILKG